jgi:hypothetical protein
MYRIDENTFIDETLITCAEYQLFIDEMRNKGKYHQPDHWASYQFMPGHGRQPILGMRHTDAEAFCAWLSQRENNGWRYHLPTTKEAASHELKPYIQTPLGYWLAGTKENHFTWNGHPPLNPRGLAHNIEIAPELSHNLSMARSRASALDMGHDIEIARSLDMDVGNSRELVQGRNNTSTLDRDFNLALGLALARDIALDRIRDRTLVRGHTRELAHALAINLSRSHELGLDLVLDIYLDLLTLQERIAGRSQPFEGIRIVKERIKHVPH